MGNQNTHIKKCLFCGTEAKSFKKLEHIIPESLGNKTYVLNTAVCDDCNKYFSNLENYFVHHHLASAIRLLSLSETKKGKPPMQPLEGGEIRKQKDGKLELTQSKVESESFSITFFANDIVIKGTYNLPETDAKKISRILSKIGLETLFLKERDIAFSHEYNQIRYYARYGNTLKFIPFLWKSRNEINIDLKIAEISNNSSGIYKFAAIYVPGCIYYIPLHRFTETHAFDYLAELYSLIKVYNPTKIKRDPISFEAWGSTIK